MPKILLEAQNPLDIPPADLEPLAQAIRDVGQGYEVQIAEPVEQRGYGVTWWEVVLIYIGSRGAEVVLTNVVNDLYKVAVGWARARFQKEPGRPKYIAIRGPDGEILRSVEVRRPDAEPEDKTEEDRRRDEESGQRPPPPTVSE